MEEWVGGIWHKLVTRAARSHYPESEVSLEAMRKPVAILFRAMGGDPALKVDATPAWAHGAKRSFMSRIAGNNQTIELAWSDSESLRLPPSIACFADQELNRSLYLWLACLNATDKSEDHDWIQQNRYASRCILEHFPGMADRYQTLVKAHIEQRDKPETLTGEVADYERYLQSALLDPWTDQKAIIKPVTYSPQPVPIWMHPCPPISPTAKVSDSDEEDEDDQIPSPSEEVETDKRKRGERVDNPDGKSGLLAFRLESLFSRAEYVAVDRPTEDDEDNNGKSAIEDLDTLSMSRDRSKVGAKLRFDLDLPPQENDDVYLGDGIPLPEWDFKRQCLQADYCRLQAMIPRDIIDTALPAHLKSKAKRLKTMFELVKPQRIWQSAQPDGSELDITALIHRATERQLGRMDNAANVYRNLNPARRDLSCLLLADLSLSTDAYINDEQRVIDIIRDSLFLFSEALHATDDNFAIYGFSSRNRNHVRYHTLKTFSERLTDTIRGRIAVIKPGYYTRMGAAIRHSITQLEQQHTNNKLLLLLTDGKPNDLDKYEGRYGVEDTKQAVKEALKAGIQPFCVTIDKKAGAYLPYIFGSQHYLLIRNAGELPAKLPAIYARLTRH